MGLNPMIPTDTAKRLQDSFARSGAVSTILLVSENKKICTAVRGKQKRSTESKLSARQQKTAGSMHKKDTKL